MGLDMGVEEQIPDIIFDEEDVSWITAITDLLYDWEVREII